jgi:hypothetical protein
MPSPAPFRLRAWARLVAFALIALVHVCSPAAQPTISREYQVKAVFLYNFVQFVRWPPSAFETPEAPFVIGLIGADHFEGALDEAVAGETVRGRAIVVKRFNRLEDARSAHVLFVSDSEQGNIDRVVASLRGQPILMVSDSPGFARRGGTIGFYFDGPKLRFEINAGEAQRNGLQLSSQLLNLARIVPAVANAFEN